MLLHPWKAFTVPPIKLLVHSECLKFKGALVTIKVLKNYFIQCVRLFLGCVHKENTTGITLNLVLCGSVNLLMSYDVISLDFLPANNCKY